MNYPNKWVDILLFLFLFLIFVFCYCYFLFTFLSSIRALFVVFIYSSYLAVSVSVHLTDVQHSKSIYLSFSFIFGREYGDSTNIWNYKLMRFYEFKWNLANITSNSNRMSSIYETNPTKSFILFIHIEWLIICDSVRIHSIFNYADWSEKINSICSTFWANW